MSSLWPFNPPSLWLSKWSFETAHKCLGMPLFTSNSRLTLYCSDKWDNNKVSRQPMVYTRPLRVRSVPATPSSVPWSCHTASGSLMPPTFSVSWLYICFSFSQECSFTCLINFSICPSTLSSGVAFTSVLSKTLLDHIICYMIFWFGYFGNFYPEDILIPETFLCIIIWVHFDG